jgi:hypothetical protein
VTGTVTVSSLMTVTVVGTITVWLTVSTIEVILGLVEVVGAVVVVVRVPEQPQSVVRVEVTVIVTVLRVVALGPTCLGNSIAVWL